MLAAHFLRQHAGHYRKPLKAFDEGAIKALLAHGWPGNVRELDHAVERAVLMAQADAVRAVDLGLRDGCGTRECLTGLPPATVFDAASWLLGQGTSYKVPGTRSQLGDRGG